MKKLLALILTGALTMGALSACGSTAVVAVPPPQESEPATPIPDQPREPSGEAVKTGLYLSASVSGSKSAADGEDGLGQADIDLVAVTVTDEGVIDSCVIDSIQSKVSFDAAGNVTADLTAPVPSKNELGSDYGMGQYSPIGKEWNQQAQALADYVEGKTVEELQGIAVTEEGRPADADLAASVTISIGGYLDAIQQAVANATHLGASQGDRLALTTSTNVASSKSATQEEDGLVQTYATVAAVTLSGDMITSCYIDAVQANVNFDTAGTVTSDLTAAQPSKNQLGDDYGMKKASSIGKEWYEQAAAFCTYVTGKTLDQVAGLAVTETGAAADADLAASVTLSIGEFQALLAKAGAEPARKRRHMKRILTLLLLLALLCGCTAAPAEPTGGLKRYQATFLTLFDTVTTIVGYAELEEAFTATAQAIHDQLLEYHQLYDIYNEYEGLSNIKTINDHAWEQPVEVDQRIIDLLQFSKELYTQTGGRVNIAMGSVLRLWHDAREAGIQDPGAAALPDGEALELAAAHTDIDSIQIDPEQGTVFLSDPEVRLDVGAIAKGYAVEQVCRNAPSGLLISVGGNVRATGPKPENGQPWVVGVQDPDDSEQYLHTLYVKDRSVVTSGDYQRYFTVDGVAYHHIIDPDTLFPAGYWRAVTILCGDSGVADTLSTALFTLPQEEGQALLDAFGAEAMWVRPDGTVLYSPGFQAYIRV